MNLLDFYSARYAAGLMELSEYIDLLRTLLNLNELEHKKIKDMLDKKEDIMIKNANIHK